jgi:hypothetical protein
VVRIITVMVIVLLAVGTVNVQAQLVTFDGCTDFRGAQVASVLDNSIRDVAIAGYAAGGAPIIRYNTVVLSWFSPQTRLFWYGHECAHHKLAHAIRNIPFSQEQEADCWSIRTLVRAGLVDEDDVNVIADDLGELGSGDWTHLPGPIRRINLHRCLGGNGGGPGPQPAPAQLPYCCDAFGNRRCVIGVNSGPIGSPCFCAGQGYGVTCP